MTTTDPHTAVPGPSERLADDLRALRRAVHADPEVGLQVPRTRARVLEALDGLGLEVRTGSAATSVTAVLRGGRPGPAVLLRADMDALVMDELTDLPYASGNGAMHSCGHDLHLAALVGAAHLLGDARAELAGDVVLMFQPGEETLDGATTMIAEGVLDAAGSTPVAAYGLHVAADVPHGVLATRSGPLMAACHLLEVTVVGSGGHGGRPERARDPIQVAAEVVTALQTFLSRRFAAFDPVVATVGEFHAGHASNVVPESATFRAGVRTFGADAGRRVAAELPAMIEGLVAAHGLRAVVRCEAEVPVTVNDAAEARRYRDTAEQLLGPERIVDLPHPVSASEDFSHVLERVPGAFGFLGAATPGADPEQLAGNHSPRAVFDDGVLPDQTRLLAGLAVRRLTAG